VRLALALTLLAALASPAFAQDAPDAAALFTERCSSCHTIGKGARVGPDLQGVVERRDRDWLFKMIQQPSALLDSDPDAKALLAEFNGVRMPDLGLTDAEVNALIDYIGGCADGGCDTAGAFTPATESTPKDIALGRDLFLGNVALSNGGPPCVSCHSVRGTESAFGGGTLAIELTHSFARLGDEGMAAALKNPAFPLMKDIYSQKKLTDDEAFALRSFFAKANRTTSGGGDQIHVALAGGLGAIVVLFILNACWSRRLRGVRKPITRGDAS